MPLGKHSKNKNGLIRKERSNTLVGTLAGDYSVLSKYNPRMKLGTLEKKLHVNSLNQVLKKVRK